MDLNFLSHFAGLSAPPLGVAALVGVAIEAALAVGSYYLASAMSKARSPNNELLDQPDNPISRGGFINQVLGHRAGGPYITWVGGLFSEQIAVGGGAKGSSSTPSTLWYASGMHVLCLGPMRRLNRIYINETIIWDQVLDSSTTADGTAIDCISGGVSHGTFRIYFGRAGQPVDTLLEGQMGIASQWPFAAMVVWDPAVLGPSPNWGVYKYDFEVHVADQAAAAGLDLTPLNTPDWIDEETPTDGVVTVWLNGEQPIPAGNYVVEYDGGAVAYTGDLTIWSVNTAFSQYGFFMVDGSGTVLFECPGNGFIYASQAAAETANVGATSSPFSWAGGVLGIKFVTNNYAIAWPGTPNPTFTVAPVSGIGPTYTASTIVTPGEEAVGNSGTNGIASLYLLLCAPFPWGCGISPDLIDNNALACAAAEIATEQLVCNILISKGRDASEVIGSLMRDIGMLLPDVGGLLTPYLIRPDPSPITVPDDAIEKTGITYEQQTAFFNPSRLTFLIDDVLFDFQQQDVHLDNDAQAFTDLRPKTEQVTLENITDRTTGYAVANRKQLELMTQSFQGTSVTLMREARNPGFHPGRAFIAQGLPLRVTGWRPDAKGITAEIDIALDQYGNISNAAIPADAAFNYSSSSSVKGGGAPGAGNQDLYFLPALQQPGYWPTPTQPTFVVPRIRASSGVIAANIWASTSSSGPYTMVGTQNAWGFGGTLNSALTGTGAIATGPNFTASNSDSSAVIDLTGDASSYAAGAQRLFVAESTSALAGIPTVEQMKLGAIAAAGTGTWTSEDLFRGPYSEPPTNGFPTVASGSTVVIAQEAQLTQIYTPLIIQAIGASLWIKTQPVSGSGTGASVVDLSTVTPMELVIPSGLIDTITVETPATGQVVVVGSPVATSAITFTAPWATPGSTQFDILVSEDGGTTWAAVNGTTNSTAETAFIYYWTSTGLTASTTALIKVQSHADPTIFGLSGVFTLEDGDPPTGTITLTATPGSGSVSLSWTPATFDGTVPGASGYHIARWISGAPPSPLAAIIDGISASLTTYTDTDVVSGTTYSYIVRAFQGGGATAGGEDASNVVNATPT